MSVVAVGFQPRLSTIVVDFRRGRKRQLEDAPGVGLEQMPQALADLPAPGIGSFAKEAIVAGIAPVEVEEMRVQAPIVGERL